MKLLMVCLGNICRSPLAEGALRHQLQQAKLSSQVEVDSAGTGDWHIGHAPDPRSIACAKQYGVDISNLRARQLTPHDFEHFDWILCADPQNVKDAQAIAPPHLAHKAVLYLPWSGLQETIIPDPYYDTSSNHAEFEQVWQLVNRAAAAWIADFNQKRNTTAQ